MQRARDMCSFSHDRYRQAAITEAENLSEDTVSKMSFRVNSGLSSLALQVLTWEEQIVLMLLHERIPDPHRIAEHAKRFDVFLFM